VNQTCPVPRPGRVLTKTPKPKHAEKRGNYLEKKKTEEKSYDSAERHLERSVGGRDIARREWRVRDRKTTTRHQDGGKREGERLKRVLAPNSRQERKRVRIVRVGFWGESDTYLLIMLRFGGGGGPLEGPMNCLRALKKKMQTRGFGGGRVGGSIERRSNAASFALGGGEAICSRKKDSSQGEGGGDSARVLQRKRGSPSVKGLS